MLSILRNKACVVYSRISPFWIYTTVSFFKTFSPLSLCVCVCVKILSILKRKNSGLIPHWKMRVSYRDLKPVLCIQELSPFGYTPLLVSLKPSPFSPCVCVKILRIGLVCCNNSCNGIIIYV